MSTEAALESRVRAYCKKHDVEFWKFVSPGRKGVPDRLLIGPLGRMAFIEFKSPTGKPSALQLREQANLKRRGVPYLLTDSFGDCMSLIQTLIPRNGNKPVGNDYTEDVQPR